MFASNITINDNAAAARTFKQISADGSNSVRIDDSTTAVLPRQMVIRHSVSTPKGSSVKVDRHLLQFSVTKADAAGASYTGVINVTLSQPRTSAIVAADYDHLWAFVKNWLTTSGNFSGLQLGEY